MRAVVEGSRDHVYQAALLDPNTAATLTVEQIVNMVDELIEAHGELDPRGHPARRQLAAAVTPRVTATRRVA